MVMTGLNMFRRLGAACLFSMLEDWRIKGGWVGRGGISGEGIGDWLAFGSFDVWKYGEYSFPIRWL